MFKKWEKVVDVIGYSFVLLTIIFLAFNQKIHLDKTIHNIDATCLEIIEDILFLKQLTIQDSNNNNLGLLNTQFKYFTVTINNQKYQLKLNSNLNDLPANIVIKVDDYLLKTNQSNSCFFKEKIVTNNIYYSCSAKFMFIFIQLTKFIILNLLISIVVLLGKLKLKQFLIVLAKHTQNNNDLILQKLSIHEKLTKIFIDNTNKENNINVFDVIKDCIDYFSLEINNKKLNVQFNNENTIYKLSINIKVLYTIVISILYKILITMPKKSIINISFHQHNENLSLVFEHNGFKFNEKQFFKYSNTCSKNLNIWLVNTAILLKILSGNEILYHFTNNTNLNILKLNIPLYNLSNYKNDCQIFQFNPSFNE